MKSHYENLGVPIDADADEIKRAYRMKANQTHPDKGGDENEFVKVAKAFEVLSDPERKLLYDTTGQDRRPPIAKEAESLMFRAFREALMTEDDIEVLPFVRKGFERVSSALPSQVQQLQSRKEKLTVKREKITSNGNVNLAHLIIDAEIQSIDGQLSNIEYQQEVIAAAITSLDEYEEDWEETESQMWRYEDAMRRNPSSIGFRY